LFKTTMGWKRNQHHYLHGIRPDIHYPFDITAGRNRDQIDS